VLLCSEDLDAHPICPLHPFGRCGLLSLCSHQFLSQEHLKASLANIPCHTDPFAEADEDTGETKQSQNYIHIRIQREFTFPTLMQERTAQPRVRRHLLR
jgi:hypothetical protein